MWQNVTNQATRPVTTHESLDTNRVQCTHVQSRGVGTSAPQARLLCCTMCGSGLLRLQPRARGAVEACCCASKPGCMHSAAFEPLSLHARQLNAPVPVCCWLLRSLTRRGGRVLRRPSLQAAPRVSVPACCVKQHSACGMHSECADCAARAGHPPRVTHSYMPAMHAAAGAW